MIDIWSHLFIFSNIYLNTMTTSVTNVFKNLAAPVSRSSDVAMGFGIDVVLESAISWGIRYLAGARVGFFEIVVTVVLAAPLIGVGSFMTVDNEKGNLKESTYKYRFMSGLQTVPSIFLSQYIVGTYQTGKFYIPKLDLMHIVITTVARTLSRVIILFANEKEWWGMDKWRQYQGLQEEQIAGGTFAKEKAGL